MPDASRITIAGNAHIYLAALGTVGPTDATTALDTPWRDVGYTTEDSLTFTDTPTFGQVRSHQSNYPTRIFQTQEEASVAVELQEFSSDNILATFGGGTITTITPGGTATDQYHYSPPSVGSRVNIAAIAEVIDGTKHYRYVVPNCFQNSGATLKLQKTSAALLPLALSVLGADGVDPWYLLTDDPAMAPST